MKKTKMQKSAIFNQIWLFVLVLVGMVSGVSSFSWSFEEGLVAHWKFDEGSGTT